MSKKSKKMEESRTTISTVSGTRDAVESAIDLSKGDDSITWEKSAAKSLGKISRWEETKKRPTPPSQPSL